MSMEEGGEEKRLKKKVSFKILEDNVQCHYGGKAAHIFKRNRDDSSS